MSISSVKHDIIWAEDLLLPFAQQNSVIILPTATFNQYGGGIEMKHGSATKCRSTPVLRRCSMIDLEAWQTGAHAHAFDARTVDGFASATKARIVQLIGDDRIHALV